MWTRNLTLNSEHSLTDPCHRDWLLQSSHDCSMHTEKVKVKVIQSWLFVTPQTIQSMGFSRPEYWSGYPFPSPGDLPSPGIERRSPSLQMDSLPAEPQGKPKNTGVGILSLLQRIFLTQESNQGLLHCRQILYQLSNEGCPRSCIALRKQTKY